MSFATLDTGVTADGVTTIRWGTESDMADASNANSSYYVVDDVRQEQVKVLQDNLPNGNGLTRTRVIVTDGVRWNVDVREDTRMTPPNIGTQVYLVDKQCILASSPAAYKARVVDAGRRATPKSAGVRTIVVERLTLIDT